MLVGIIGAMKIEVDMLVKSMEINQIKKISTIDFYRGKLNGHEVVIATCGIGKVNAAICAQTMIMQYSPDIIINTGVAGSLRSSLEIGSCAIASSVVQYDVDTTAFGDPLGMISGINVVLFHCEPWIVKRLTKAVASLNETSYEIGVIATGDRFLGREDDKKDILEQFAAIACEMESGSIGQVCYLNETPFGVVRAISDNADSTSCLDYEEFLNSAALKAAEIVKLFLEGNEIRD